MPEYFGVLAQIRTENETEIYTKEYSKTISEELPQVLDVLFKITYYTEKLDSGKINFKSYCNDHYMQAPYTFKCLLNIFIAGYYNEVMIMLRHLYEVLAKLKYFYKHEDKLQGYLHGDWIPESKFFRLDSDDTFYKIDYNFLSRFAHGKDLFTVYRTKRPNFKEFVLGNHFDKEFVDFILIQIIALIYGYLNCYVLFFPDNEICKDSIFSELYNETINGLEGIMAWHKQNNPESINWYSSIDKFISR